MSIYKSLFKQTVLYGLATVLPRVISVILTPFYINYLPKTNDFANVTIIFSYLVFFNVVLSYGMETAFFRFYNSTDSNNSEHENQNKKKVIATATISIFWTTILLTTLGLLFRETIASLTQINIHAITYSLWILAFDALVIIPFAILRAEKKPLKYALLKISNVLLNLLLNVFFLVVLPKIATTNTPNFFQTIYFPNFQIEYIFIANLIASLFTLILLFPSYFNFKWQLNFSLWGKMLQYGLPVLIAGMGFAINEHFDKIMLDWLQVPKNQIGAYSACYKIGVFMVLFRTAFTLGIEPFFFSQANNQNAPQMYANITKYFCILGSFILLFVIVFIDWLKLLLVPKPVYWSAMHIVPPIILANFMLGIYTNLSVWYKIINKTHIGAIISIIGASITLVLNYLFIPKIGYLASAIATLIAYGSMMYISYNWGQKKYPIPYATKTIATYIFLAISIASLSFYVAFLRESIIFKIFAILLFGYYIYHNEKNNFLKIIKKN